MSIEVAIAAIVALLFVWAGVRWYQARAALKEDEETPQLKRTTSMKLSKERSKVAHESTPYHAVSIRFLPSACEAARALKGKRFLSAAAPRLPLPECDVLECKCRFVHHADRRSGDDRRSRGPRGFGSETGSFEVERRKRPERRHDDDEPENLFK